MKNYNLQLLPTAKKDIADMIDYLSQFYPSTAVKQYDKIMEEITKLKYFPLMCEEYGTVMGLTYRKMVVERYLVFYVVRKDTVEIHRIINGKMEIAFPQSPL